MSFLSQAIVTLVGIVYPAFYTYKSLKNKTQQQRLIWLRYWVSFSCYYAVTTISDYVLFWLPFYDLVKITLLLWLVAAKASGANLLYIYALDPLIKANEKQIDSLVRRKQKRFTELFWKLFSGLGLSSSAVVLDLLKRQLWQLSGFGGGDGLYEESRQGGQSHASAVGPHELDSEEGEVDFDEDGEEEEPLTSEEQMGKLRRPLMVSANRPSTTSVRGHSLERHEAASAPVAGASMVTTRSDENSYSVNRDVSSLATHTLVRGIGLNDIYCTDGAGDDETGDDGRELLNNNHVPKATLRTKSSQVSKRRGRTTKSETTSPLTRRNKARQGKAKDKKLEGRNIFSSEEEKEEDEHL